MIHIVDAWGVSEVLGPLYESPKILAQKMTIEMHCDIFSKSPMTSGEIPYGAGRQPSSQNLQPKTQQRLQ